MGSLNPPGSWKLSLWFMESLMLKPPAFGFADVPISLKATLVAASRAGRWGAAVSTYCCLLCAVSRPGSSLKWLIRIICYISYLASWWPLPEWHRGCALQTLCMGLNVLMLCKDQRSSQASSLVKAAFQNCPGCCKISTWTPNLIDPEGTTVFSWNFSLIIKMLHDFFFFTFAESFRPECHFGFFADFHF